MTNSDIIVKANKTPLPVEKFNQLIKILSNEHGITFELRGFDVDMKNVKSFQGLEIHYPALEAEEKPNMETYDQTFKRECILEEINTLNNTLSANADKISIINSPLHQAVSDRIMELVQKLKGMDY